jgi:hypothetical protein
LEHGHEQDRPGHAVGASFAIGGGRISLDQRIARRLSRQMTLTDSRVDPIHPPQAAAAHARPVVGAGAVLLGLA